MSGIIFHAGYVSNASVSIRQAAGYMSIAFVGND